MTNNISQTKAIRSQKVEGGDKQKNKQIVLDKLPNFFNNLHAAMQENKRYTNLVVFAFSGNGDMLKISRYGWVRIKVTNASKRRFECVMKVNVNGDDKRYRSVSVIDRYVNSLGWAGKKWMDHG